MRNGGEACVAANRILVHRAVLDDFIRAFVARMEGFVTGPGTEASTTLGPLIDERSRQRVAAMVAEATSQGATVVTGGTVPQGQGYSTRRRS